MKMTGANWFQYSLSYAWIRNLSSRLNERKYAAFEKHGRADKTKVNAACAPNSGPDLVMVYFGPGKEGQINPQTGKPEINELLVKAFEKRVITGVQLDRIVEHELTHWFYDAWAEANPANPGEMRGHGDVGYKYENDAYGPGRLPDYTDICRQLYGGNCP